MAEVRVRGLVKRYGRVAAVDGLSLDIRDGEFVVLLGPSGCGKTTTLRSIAGLETPDSGDVYIDGDRVTHYPPSMRDIAMVFQSFALYPHLSVRDNLSFPLRASRATRAHIEERVREVARVLHVEALLDRRPGKLSGGEMQRVAIGRAMVRRPKVFLMDEPLTNLDAKLRTEMRAELKRLQNDLGATTVYVTHDQLEAMSLGNRIAVMSMGVIQQIGTPEDVYSRPANLFVAGFIGSPAMNTLACTLSDDRAALVFPNGTALGLQPCLRERLAKTPDGARLVLGVRPEDVLLARKPTHNHLTAMVYVLEPLGSENIIDLELAGTMVKARTAPTFEAAIGDKLYAMPDQARCCVFDAVTGEAVS